MADDGPISEDDNTRGVTTPELQARLLRGLLSEGVHCMIPARVEKYDSAKQMANVQILIKDFHCDQTGALVVTSIPIVNNVHVQFLSAGGFALTVPVEVGTLGSLMFAERSLDQWSAGGGQEVDPKMYSRFNLSDAVFLPGVRTFGDPLAYVPAGKIKMGQDDSSGGRIEIDSSGEVSVHAASGQKVTIDAGAGANVEIAAGALGTVKINGGGRQVAAQGDTAGPYPLACTGLFVERS